MGPFRDRLALDLSRLEVGLFSIDDGLLGDILFDTTALFQQQLEQSLLLGRMPSSRSPSSPRIGGDPASCLLCAGKMSPDDGSALPPMPSDRGFIDGVLRAMVRPFGLRGSVSLSTPPGTALLTSRPRIDDILVL